MAKKKSAEPSNGSEIQELIEKTKRIQLPKVKTGRMTVVLEGETRLVVHNFSEKARREMEEGSTGKSRNKKTPRNPEQECKDALYEFPDKPGKYFIPGRWFKLAIVRSCKGLEDAAMTDARQYIRVLDEWIEVVGSSPRMRRDVVRLQGNKATMRYRPEFIQWRCALHILFNYSFFTPEQILQALTLAGAWGGVGEDRPEKSGGDWGLFKIVEVPEVRIS